MIISPFTPLSFEKRNSDGVESPYIQTFSRTDCILVQMFETITTGQDPATGAIVQLVDKESGKRLMLEPNYFQISGNYYLYFLTLQGLSNGFYSLYIVNNGSESNVFRVTDDPCELENTVLIQYAMKDNKRREDTMFNIGGFQYFFSFRVPGGFKDSQWTFGVENEQFMTSQADIVELSSLDYTAKKFTLGGADGVPVWFGEMLNRLLTCHYVYFDGVRYARKDASTPEMTVQIEGLDSFVFNQQLQKVNYLDPKIENRNSIAMRRTGEDYRLITDNINRIIQ